MNVTETRVVVTGAGSGIGRATAIRFSQDAADVVCVDIDSGAAEATAELCASDATTEVCDVSDPTAVQALAERIESDRGPVDVLVNNAGVGVGGPFLETSIEDWDWLTGINLNGVAYGCHAFGGPMVERGRGHIVNIASGAAYVMSRDMAAYCASKAGVVALSRCLRADWSEAGVGVTAICPGAINTPIAMNSRMFGAMAAQQDRIAASFRRFAHSPDIVAKAIVRAVEKNHEVVPVGIESSIAYRMLPFVPARVQHYASRTRFGGLV
jgi:2-hydroxycyclohexanecarboxyl-CoA dehydrogenase